MSRNLGREKEKLVALFVDFKAAFDLVKEILKETKIRVRLANKEGKFSGLV